MIRPVAVAVAVTVAACGCAGSIAPSDGGEPDLGVLEDLAVGEAVAPVFAALTFTGCAKLDFAGGQPRCAGPAPLTVGLVPLAPAGVMNWLWTAPGGDPASSMGASPEVR